MDDALTDRHPCPDDLCVGVLDAEGVCGTCGRQGEVPPEGHAAAGPGEDREALEAKVEAEVPKTSAAHAVDEDERHPCPDEMCTGILGADGVCGTCGRAGG